MAKKRGITISLAHHSWWLICEALTYVAEKPHLDDLEEHRDAIGRLLSHIKGKLEEE